MATNYNYSPGCGVCLGVFHILFGLGSCGCGIASILLQAYAYEFAVGIWAGIVFYGITGVLALASSRRNNNVITACYIMSLLSVFVAMGQMGLYVLAVINEMWLCGDSAYWNANGSCSYNQVQDLILHSVLVLMAFLEWIIAMVSCCVACSCCYNASAPPTQTVVIHRHQPMPFQETYGGPAVMMPPPQAPYGGHPGSSNPAPVHNQPAPDYNKKPRLISDGAPGDPAVYQNPTFNQAMPTEESASLPHTANY